MAKLKEGDVLKCKVCGLVVIVDEACGCAAGEIICCKDQPMVKGKAAAGKATKKPAVKATTKAAAAKNVKIKAKAAIPAKAAKPAAKAKKAPTAKTKSKK